MTDRQPAPSRRAVRAAWILARAFTPNAAWAMLALPSALLAVLPATLRRGLFLDATRTGMVLLAPLSLAWDLLALIPIFATLAVGAFGALLLATSLHIAPALFIVAAVVLPATLAGALFLLPRRGSSAMPFGPETSPGPRWELSGLAQLPGSRLTAIQTARRVLAAVPPAGAVVVATANTPAQFEQYQRLGFIGGDKRRVHRVVA